MPGLLAILDSPTNGGRRFIRGSSCTFRRALTWYIPRAYTYVIDDSHSFKIDNMAHKQRPCRVHITLSGLECYLHNRITAFDNIVSEVQKQESPTHSATQPLANEPSTFSIYRIFSKTSFVPPDGECQRWSLVENVTHEFCFQHHLFIRTLPHLWFLNQFAFPIFSTARSHGLSVSCPAWTQRICYLLVSKLQNL
jgi:hypothetical protein